MRTVIGGQRVNSRGYREDYYERVPKEDLKADAMCKRIIRYLQHQPYPVKANTLGKVFGKKKQGTESSLFTPLSRYAEVFETDDGCFGIVGIHEEEE